MLNKKFLDQANFELQVKGGRQPLCERIMLKQTAGQLQSISISNPWILMDLSSGGVEMEPEE